MKSVLSEAEKKEILETNTEKVTETVTRRVTRKVTTDVTVKTLATTVLTVKKKMNTTADEAIAFLDIPLELQEAVLEEVKRLS